MQSSHQRQPRLQRVHEGRGLASESSPPPIAPERLSGGPDDHQRVGSPPHLRHAKGRMYICANVRRATGLCDASAIRAELIESHVLRHLDSFVGSVEGWLQEQVGKRSDERREREAALERQRVKLSDLDRQRDRHLAEYRALVDEGKTTARIALEEVERIDRECAGQQQAIDEAEAVLGEWSDPLISTRRSSTPLLS